MRIGEAITLTGQASDRHVEKSLNSYMNDIMKTVDVDYVTYGDTDSLYLNVEPLVKKVYGADGIISLPGDKIVEFLDKVGSKIQHGPIQSSIDHIFEKCNCYEKLMDMKREAIYSKALWTSKKRYAMVVHNSEGVDYNPPKLKIMGLDIIKASTPQKVRDKLKTALKMMFDEGEEAVQKYIVNVKTDFMKMQPEEVAFPRGCNDLDKWSNPKQIYDKGTPIHVRGALLYNHYTKSMKKYTPIANKDKVKFIYLKLPNTIKEDVIAFPAMGAIPSELNLTKYIDWDLQFEKTFLAPLDGLIKAAGWSMEEQSSLEDFFG